MAAAAKRQYNEYNKLVKAPGFGVKVDEERSDVGTRWIIILDGPEGSGYQGGKFELDFVFENYPFKCPKVKFITKIYHPNIDDSGEICAIIYENDWAPTKNIENGILNQISSLLVAPDPSNAQREEIGQMYTEDNKKFLETAKDWTKKFAKAK